MATIADATGKFADRIVELLDVFDLSFFVSGAVALGAVASVARAHDLSLPTAVGRLVGASGSQLDAMDLVVLIVVSYALGLGCFALGRVARAALFRDDIATLVRDAVEHHPIADVLDFGAYMGDATSGSPTDNARLGRLYHRLWVHVRTVPELSTSFALVKRYWVLAATFDGMGVALLAWVWPSLVGVAGWSPGPGLGAATVFAAVAVASAAVCWRQAAEYRRYQVDELVATAVHWKALRDAPAARADPA